MQDPSSNKYAELQGMKYENPEYWGMMDLSHGTDPVVRRLVQAMPSGSVFEFGAWRGRNAIPLAEIKNFYSDWEVSFEEVSTSEPSKSTWGRSMTRVALLLKNASR